MKDISLFPLLTDRHVHQMGFRIQSDMSFFYTRNGEKQFFDTDASSASIKPIGDSRWDPENDDFGISGSYTIKNPALLFGERGLLCSDATAGLAAIWKSPDSRQRGAIPFGEFTRSSRDVNMELSYVLGRAGLRGRVTVDVVLYVKKPGNPSENELGLANLPGFVLGTLKSYSVLLDGDGAVFQFNEEAVPGGLLWRVVCDFEDSLSDSFYDSVEIDVNPLHPAYKFIDTKSRDYTPEMLREVITSAMTVAFMTCQEKSEEKGEWSDVLAGKAERGSVGDVLMYFMSKHGVDPESSEVCSEKLRKAFETLKL